MSTRAGTVPLSDLQFLKIYFNRKRLRSTTANLKKMLAEAGGDAICNGSIFLRNQTPACHLKADGKVYKAPNYRAWAISWNTPADFDVKTVPNGDRNYMECVHLIIGGKKISPVTCGADMKYRAPRTAIGTKNGRFAYYVSKYRRTPEQLRFRSGIPMLSAEAFEVRVVRRVNNNTTTASNRQTKAIKARLTFRITIPLIQN